MNTRVEAGLSCDIDGDGNSKLSSPNNLTYLMYAGEEVLAIWGKVAHLVKKSTDQSRGELYPEDVLVLVSLGKMQLWVFSEGDTPLCIVLTKLVQHPRKKICEVCGLAGYRLDEGWAKFSAYWKNWMWQNGATEMQATCRPEMVERLARFGFEPLVTVLKLSSKE